MPYRGYALPQYDAAVSMRGLASQRTEWERLSITAACNSLTPPNPRLTRRYPPDRLCLLYPALIFSWDGPEQLALAVLPGLAP